MVAELAHAAEALVERDARGLQLLAEPALAVAARRRVLRAGDQGDPPVPELHQRLRDEPSTTAIVGHDGVDVDVVEVPVDEHHRRPSWASRQR